MGDFEDDEHREFFRLEKPAGEDAVLSRAAVDLSAFGLSASVRRGTPGFISDTYLNEISAETTLTAMELVVAGEWTRGEGGYEITDPDMKALAARLHRQQEDFDDWPVAPEDCDDHMDGPNSRGSCIRCGPPVDEPVCDDHD